MSTPSRRARRAGVPALIASAALALAACSGAAESDPSTPGSAPATIAPASTAPASSASPSATAQDSSASAISISGFAFEPASLTVPVGTTVTWTNDEDSLHTVTSGTPDERTEMFDSGEIDSGVEFEVTFEEAGAYPFFCDRHEFMRGEVTVAP